MNLVFNANTDIFDSDNLSAQLLSRNLTSKFSLLAARNLVNQLSLAPGASPTALDKNLGSHDPFDERGANDINS